MALRLSHESLTFDDVLLLPGYSEVLPHEVSLKTQLTPNIALNIPLLSAAMDTVTEARLAIAMAQEGGIGVIHKNFTIEDQAAQVLAVKKFESGVVKNPITIRAERSVGELVALTEQHGISGLPVVDGNDLVGIVTQRDFRFVKDMSKSVSSIMTPKDQLVTVKEGVSQDEVKALLQAHRIEKILVVNDAFELTGMITVKDIEKAKIYPNACKDEFGRLRVAAAVGVLGSALGQARIEALIEAGVDVLVVDTAHGHTKGVMDTVSWIKQHYPQMQVIAGNIATADAAKALADVGVDAVKVGIGPGSICTTRIVSGVGVPQISAIAEVADRLQGYAVSLIADGGVRFSGDLAKALVAGAHAVMVGGLLAGTDEAPGEVELYQGRSYKAYRGMGSLGAMAKGSSDRYFQDAERGVEKLVPEGIEGRVPYKGSMHSIVHQLVGGVRASMGYTGSPDIETMRLQPKFTRVTASGMSESHVHDVSITKEAPNYRIG